MATINIELMQTQNNKQARKIMKVDYSPFKHVKIAPDFEYAVARGSRRVLNPVELQRWMRCLPEGMKCYKNNFLQIIFYIAMKKDLFLYLSYIYSKSQRKALQIMHFVMSACRI